MRKIIHIDMDAFYAAVALRERPDLRDQPVVVAWDGPRSVVCAASYPARRYGLRSAMAVATAKRLCPHAVFLPPDFNQYRAVSAQIHTIFARYTAIIEPLSLDEAYLDVTDYQGNLPYARDIARAIRTDIRRETGLTASAGIAPNKFLAKIASDWRKPDGQFVIAPAQILAFLADLPVGKIPGVGKVTQQKMQALGWHTVGALATAERAPRKRSKVASRGCTAPKATACSATGDAGMASVGWRPCHWPASAPSRTGPGHRPGPHCSSRAWQSHSSGWLA